MRNRLCTLLVLLSAACGQSDSEKPGQRAAAEAAMSRGTGLLEAFRYSEAREELAKAVELAPDWTDAKVNYAIALMNLTSDETSGEGLATKALEVVAAISAAEPDNAHARFLLGFLTLRTGGDVDEALAHLRAVPQPDATTLCWIGQGEMERGDIEASLRVYDKAIRLDRHLAAAYYGRFTCLVRLGRGDEAQEAKQVWQRVRAPQQVNLLTARAYHEIGKYALAVRRYPGSRPAGRDFPWARSTDAFGGDSLPESATAIAVGDVDGDGDLDVYFPGALFENLGALRFRKKGDFPRQAGLFFDFDNDQVLDLFLYGQRDRLWRGKGDGSFKEVAQEPVARRSRFALAADLDVDGDVDIFVTEDGAPDRVLRNNRDGTLTEVPLGSAGPSRGAITFDYDRDRDPDLVVARAEGPPLRFRNDRADGFIPDGAASLPAGRALVAGDLDRDGREELIVTDAPRLLVDVDLDGVLDEVTPNRARTATAADLDGDAVPEIVGIGRDGRAFLDRARVEPGHWLTLDLRGRTAPAPPQWSAPIGPGARVEVLAGGLWQLRVARSVTGFASQHPSALTFGLGPNRRADVVRIVWPDRVLQAELDVPADSRKVIREANRKPSSCPLLFVDGAHGTRFVTDFLGSGGLGFFLERGLYGKPDPDEVVAIGPMEAIDGHYVLRVLEPLEEVSYLDEATLLAVDHPAGTEVFANERFACEEPFPKFRIWELDARVAPVRAWNDRGADVTERIAAVDRRYPPVQKDKRFKGFTKEHWLALDFTGRVPPASGGARTILVLDGWVEYGYSHSNFAAAQAGEALAPPVLEVLRGGAWVPGIANTGYPAGMPRTMTLDVTGVVTPENPVFRLRTNLEIYWDRVTVGIDRGLGRARVHRLTPAGALLSERGYPREYSPDGAQPLLYDYNLIDPGYPFKTMAGDYTRLGEVAPLLFEADDRFVIFGKGEELVLRYAARGLPPLAAGIRRTFLLYAVGFCKDMDPYTAHPYTVEPLPFRAMSNYPYPPSECYPDDDFHRRYRAEWNTRHVPKR
ncbi:MAG: CRTAC1 family protein [Planctomycetota bacterium]|jgi:tetratricopeptide (TPR) repeat protein